MCEREWESVRGREWVREKESVCACVERVRGAIWGILVNEQGNGETEREKQRERERVRLYVFISQRGERMFVCFERGWAWAARECVCVGWVRRESVIVWCFVCEKNDGLQQFCCLCCRLVFSNDGWSWHWWSLTCCWCCWCCCCCCCRCCCCCCGCCWCCRSCCRQVENGFSCSSTSLVAAVAAAPLN